MQNNYLKPPILEAIIDIQVRPDTNVLTEDALKLFLERTEGKYSTVTPINQVTFGFDTSNAASPKQHQQPPTMIGWRCAGNGAIVQLKANGFTFSRLPPYTDWDSFKADAHAAWNEYKLLIDAKIIGRYAVRFVNKINIEHQQIELFDYLNLYPKLPTDIPQDVGGLFMQLRMPQNDLGTNASAVINTALAPPDQPAKIALVLDIDLFCETEVAVENDDVWLRLDTLRERKNKLFEACITDKARELFK
jgi:uncharacterized protein (TIGR04255 family)